MWCTAEESCLLKLSLVYSYLLKVTMSKGSSVVKEQLCDGGVPGVLKAYLLIAKLPHIEKSHCNL